MKPIFYILFSIAFIGFLSCDKESVIEEFDESQYAYDYFPLEVGKYWIYQVDSTIYDNEGALVINRSSQIREDVIELFDDIIGEPMYSIQRSWRRSEEDNWQITDIWTSQLIDNKAYRTEENLKFIKFVFPPEIGKKWNGNIHIDESVIITVAGESISMYSGWDDSRFIGLNQSETLEGQTYNHVATVLLTDDEEENTIERRYALEKYAMGIGLVYKEYEILDTQCSTCTGSWAEKAEKGFILKQYLIESN